MANIGGVIETGELFMDALGGEFQPACDPTGSVHTLGRLTRNILKEEGPPQVAPDGGWVDQLSKELAWAPATAYVNCTAFELGGSFGRYGEERNALFVPISLSVSLRFDVDGIKKFRIEFFHPALFILDHQPLGPEKGMRSGTGYISVTSTSWGKKASGLESTEEKLGLVSIKDAYKARKVVTELAERAFNQ